MSRFQLRGQDKSGVDTGELIHIDSFEEAFMRFVNGGFWKLSYTDPEGRRVRLLKSGRQITVTYMDEEIGIEKTEKTSDALRILERRVHGDDEEMKKMIQEEREKLWRGDSDED